MDKLKDLKNVVKPSSGSSSSGNKHADGGDPVDKFARSELDKTGYGDKVSSQNLEKGTDAIRGAFEKQTGQHVPDSVSN